MADQTPERCDYLAIVSEWWSPTAGGGVGTAYPVLNLTTGEPVSHPLTEFPNPGAVFLTRRGTLKTWDFVILRPRQKNNYQSQKERDCSYIPLRMPDPIDNLSDAGAVAVVLNQPGFDPQSTSRQIQNPLHSVTPYFFVRKPKAVFGPLFRDAIHLSATDDVESINWRPASDSGVIYEFTDDEFSGQFDLVWYEHPAPWYNRVLASPIEFAVGDVQRAKSGRPKDALSDGEIIEWYLRRTQGVEIPKALVGSLKSACRSQPGDPPELLANRLSKVQGWIGSHAAFQEARSQFAQQYVDSAEGERRVQELFERAVAKRESEIQNEVDRRKVELAAKRKEYERQLKEASEEHEHLIGTLKEEVESLRKERNDLSDTVGRLERELATKFESLAERMKEQLPLFAALTAARRDTTRTPSTAGPEAPAAVPRRYVFEPIPPTAATIPVNSERALVDDLHATLARQHLHFARDFIANVYVCLKAEPLNLVIGPPGYGKSMLVAGIARAFGHENALLRIAVRRSWGEDRYLLGAFDSFHGRYDPGPTGLVPRMLQAEADWKAGRGGMYIVLLDEFNLAAPEYYFAQLLQALPSDGPSREVLLYDPAALGGDGFPGRVGLSPNLRFWGTINYDETTERLSPRTLDRTGMIFLGDVDVKPPLDNDTPPMQGVAAGDVFGRFYRAEDACPAEQWEVVGQVLDLLRAPEAPGPRIELSPRVQRGIRRYLANATDVLDDRVAVDFVVQQRILPVIRGRGEELLTRMERWATKLSELNLVRSSRHVRDALERSKQQFGDLDFFGY